VLSFFREDVQQLEDNAAGTNEVLGEGIFAVASLVLLVSINAQVTVLVFLPLIVIAAFIQRMAHRIKRHRRQHRQATQQVTGWVGEIFTAVQAIQVAGAEANVLQHLQQLCDRRQYAAVKDQMLTQLMDSSFSNLISIGTGGILLVAAQSIQANILTVGDFALFVYYLGYVTYFLGFFGEFLTLSKQSEVSVERVAGLLNCPAQELVAYHSLYLPTVTGYHPSLPSLCSQRPSAQLEMLTAKNLRYHYPDTHSGITDISLRLPRGSMTVITGPVGAGKTTLLRVLLGLLPLQTGTLSWNGKIIKQPARFLVPPRVAYTPQVPHLLSSTLRENIMLGADRSEAELMAAIALAALDRDLTTFPDGLETTIGANGMCLSGGQAQRTAAARMLIRQSELLVFDDLSSALDLETEQVLWARLLDPGVDASALRSRHTYLIVSHRPTVLEQADQIIVLEQGGVVFSGLFQDLPGALSTE
jgi:ATP-binding cassette, subfamily B, bacterial